jgi:hypothetical protein
VIADWRDHAKSHPLEPIMTLAAEGLVLGAGTIVVKSRSAGSNRFELVTEGAEERILALLSVAYRQAISPNVIDHVRRASAAWGRGEDCLALIHLARAGLPSLPDPERAALRLFLADRLLGQDVTPQQLLEESGIGASPLHVLKWGFNPDEPRVPKGDPGGGEWTIAGGADPAAGQPQPINYTVVQALPADAAVVRGKDGAAIEGGNPKTLLVAPKTADFRYIYADGLSIASAPFPIQIALLRATLSQGGAYDFQRDAVRQEFHPAYANASNYAVGVYMAGAGYSRLETLTIAETYALFNSTNFNSQNQKAWIAQGWDDATAGLWQ